MVLLDLSAAFDTVHHPTLLHRLSHRYGIRGTAHQWLTSYLSDRQQFVTIGGERSRLETKTCDVPQGSVMGPNLYEDYTAAPVADIFKEHNIKYHIYADDKQAYMAFDPHHIGVALQSTETCIDAVKTWMVRNWLQLNDTKTEFIIFGSKQNLSKITTTCINVGGSDIQCSDVVRSIGAYLDAQLKMEQQVSSVCRSGWYHLYQISKIRKYLTTEQTKSAIHAYVTSRLDQNNGLLIGLPKKVVGRLQILQNASARLLTGLKKRDHITPTLMQLHWLPVEQRVLFKILLLTYKALNDVGPCYLKELLVPYKPARELRSSTGNLLLVPTTHYKETEKRAFSARAPREWNKLPESIKNKPSVNSFKSALKTYLYKAAYE